MYEYIWGGTRIELVVHRLRVTLKILYKFSHPSPFQRHYSITENVLVTITKTSHNSGMPGPQNEFPHKTPFSQTGSHASLI